MPSLRPILGLLLAATAASACSNAGDDASALDAWLCEECEDNQGILQIFERFKLLWNAGDRRVSYANGTWIPGCSWTHRIPEWQCHGGHMPLTALTAGPCTSYLTYSGRQDWQEVYDLDITGTYIDGSSAIIQMQGYVSRLDGAAGAARIDVKLGKGAPIPGYGVETLGNLLATTDGGETAWRPVSFQFKEDRREYDEATGSDHYWCDKAHTASSMRGTFEQQLPDRMRPVFDEAVRQVVNGQ